MDLREFFKNKNVIQSGMWLARVSPHWVGYPFANLVGSLIANRKPDVYKQLRENISHIPGIDRDPEKLDIITKRAFLNAGKYYYDFYHTLGKPIETLRNMVHIPPEYLEQIKNIQAEGRGIQLAGIHLSNFDLGSICLSLFDLDIQGLSARNPNSGYQFQNNLRKKYNFTTTPIDSKSLRMAINKLKNGGIVAVGLDWPNHEEINLTDVFGKPAYIPLGTARLAMMTGAVTIIIAFYQDTRPGYQIFMSEPLDVIRTGNKQEEIKLNTLQYIEVFEKLVSQYPEQWMMFYKFWADHS